jgi:hypothetical protein
MEKTVYVLGSKALFDGHFYDYSQGIGHYFEVGFKNWGSIRYSLDLTLAFLEEEESKFLTEDLNHPSVTVFDKAGAKVYMREHILEWELPDEF